MTRYTSNQDWNTNSVFTLGLFSYPLDGWADLIEGQGGKEEKVRKDVFDSLVEREMPEIKVEKKFAKPKVIGSSEQRKFLVTSTAPGASTMVYVAKHGKDLFVTWRTFIKPVLNWKVLAGMVGVAWILGSLAFFVALFNTRFITAFQTSFTIGVALIILQIIILLILGAQIKGYSLAFFFVEPTYFDVDDITAMSFSAHYSILRALDKAGIDTTKLRLKREYKTNRRGDTV
jgi:hypothetical protein